MLLQSRLIQLNRKHPWDWALRVAVLLLLTGALGLAGCKPPSGMLDSTEAEHSVGNLWGFGTNLRIYHSAVMDPAGVHLDWPGYIVGVEKLGGLNGNREVTHIISYGETGSPAGNTFDACALVSLYLPGPRAVAEKEPVASCTTSAHRPEYRGDFRDSESLGDLRAALTNRLQGGQFSHVLFIVMGWNTDQQEAVRNDNQITGNLVRAAATRHAPFKPLVIGLSWPSMWALGDWWAVPTQLVRGASFFSKKGQADDVGRRFLQPILTGAILPARAAAGVDAPIIMIGHSFGARAFAAMFWNWQPIWAGVTATDKETPYTAPAPAEWDFRPKDRLVLLEGAFDISELFETGSHKLLPVLRDRRLRVTMTSSLFDTATATAIWGNYAGDRRTYARVCAKGSQFGKYDVSEIQCGDAVDPAASNPLWGLQACSCMADQETINPRLTEDQMVHYVDASKLINCQTPFGGGGAHDDFNRLEMGHFLWNEVVSKYPDQRTPREARR